MSTLRNTASARLMARFDEAAVVDSVRAVVGPEVEVRLTAPCRCCSAVIGYARDHRALWIFPQLWPVELADSTRIVGFETQEDLEGFLTTLQHKDGYAEIATTLRAAFAAGST